MATTVSGSHFLSWFGHAAGALVFGLFLALLVRDRNPGRGKALLATAVALLWNLAELAGVWWGGNAAFLAAIESSAFSLLPALLFDLAMRGEPRWSVRLGYLVSGVAVLLHVSELFRESAVLHAAGLYLVAGGFALLAVFGAFRSRKRALPVLALLFFSLSLLHFAEGESHSAWWVELFVHHAAIPLAMFVLLQDYRYVLLDALVRVLANILLAGVFAGAALAWLEKWPETVWAGVTLLFLVFAGFRQRVQGLLTALVFGRPDAEGLFQELRAEGSDAEFLGDAERRLARFFGASSAGESDAEVSVPIELPGGGVHSLRLGRRRGGRPYFSEDLEVLNRAAAKIRSELDSRRDAQQERLLAQAELRALQAQIHPHFLFNALNTLYGMIPKAAADARRTVLNLSDIFRYLLRTNQTYVSLAEELKVIEAYLEIEALRLGGRLQWTVDMEAGLERTRIPLLSLEPLVENAVKHGIAPLASGGMVRLVIRREESVVVVEVGDTGRGFSPDKTGGGGVGLENVRRRLRLCYGESAELEVSSQPGATTVRFRIPYEDSDSR